MAENTKRSKNSAKNKNKFHLFSKGGKMDITFLLLIFLILSFGLVMLFSASYADAYHRHHDSFHYIVRQLIFAIGGVCAMLAVSMLDYRVIRNFTKPMVIVSLLLLVFVFTQKPINHARRWIYIGDLFTFQPSEVAKFVLVVYLADYMTKNSEKMKNFKEGIIKPMILVVAYAGLLILEPHISGMVLIVSIAIIMLIIGGVNFWQFVFTGMIGAPLGLFVIFALGKWDRLMLRVQYWLDPYSDPSGQGYQIIQSLYAIGSGELMGVGIGNSRQKYLYLPEPQNDFIFAIVSEEIGFIGDVLLLLLFAMFIWRGFVIAIKCKDKFGTLLCSGLIVQVGVQVIYNIAVVTKIVPNTGIPLPFFSYGGTSLFMLLIQMGVILSISRENNMEDKE